jgi:hypothetical protein
MAEKLFQLSHDIPVAAQKNAKIPQQNQAFSLVEMGGLEPPTPYMRSKCSTS